MTTSRTLEASAEAAGISAARTSVGVTPPGGAVRSLLSSSEAKGLVVLAACLAVGAGMSPYFWQPAELIFSTGRYVEVGVIALAMTLVIINGDIDLSVGSMVALCAAALATLYEAGVPLTLAALAAFLLGPLLGLFNGFVVTRFGLPSLVVTLGTLALFRGAAQVIMGDRSVSGYPDGFVGIDRIGVFGTRYDIPVTLVLFGVLAVGIGLLLHRSSFGRCCFMIGSNPDAARYSGIDVARVRITAFVLSGTMAGLAAVLFTSRLGSTRSDLATGTELLVITIVVLGGTDIFGGRGSIAATTVAWCAVIALGQAMALDNVNGQTQDAVLGAVLIGSILLPHVLGAVNRRLRSARRRRPTPAAASAAQPEGSK